MENHDFLIEEYRTLRTEIERAMTELATLERNCVVAIAAIYTWLLTVTIGNTLVHLAWTIPVLLSVFGGLRSLSVGIHIHNLHTYILKIESKAFETVSDVKGWEHFLAENRSIWIRSGITILFWILLVVATFLVAVYRPI